MKRRYFRHKHRPASDALYVYHTSATRTVVVTTLLDERAPLEHWTLDLSEQMVEAGLAIELDAAKLERWREACVANGGRWPGKQAPRKAVAV